MSCVTAQVRSNQTITDDALIDLTERALGPDEYTEFPSRAKDAKSHQNAQRLLARWEKLIVSRTGDCANLDRRLARMGLDRDAAIGRFETRRRLSFQELPSWSHLLGRVLNQAAYPPPRRISELLSGLKETTTPLFPEFLHPFVAHFVSAVEAETDDDVDGVLSPDAFKQLAQHLLTRLSYLCARTIAHEMKQHSALRLLPGQTTESRYQHYVGNMLGSVEGLWKLLDSYPVLGRFLAVITQQETVNAVRLIRRLAGDRLAIENKFADGDQIGCVADIRAGLSDPHANGQTVLSLTFSNGLRLAYKPRSLAVDAAYLKLIDQLNSLGAAPSLRAARVIEGQGYGWVEWIEDEEVGSAGAVARYFERQGAHLAVFYFLCGTDFHEENFVPSGEWPVPIDLEGIGALALTYSWGPLSELPTQWRSIPDSVASIGMLPRWWGRDTDREIAVMSALTGRQENKNWPVKRPVWHGIGTDQLNLQHQYAPPNSATSLPRMNGEVVQMNHLQSVLNGFHRTYAAFRNHRELLLGDRGALSDFRDLPTRVLARSTEEYGHFLFWSTAPDILISGHDYDVAMEVLCCSRVAEDDQQGNRQPDPWRGEKCDLWARDIPYFFGSTTDTYLLCSDGSRIGPVNDQTGYDLIERRLLEASEPDQQWQSEIIRSSLAMILKTPPDRESTQKVANGSLLQRAESHLQELGESIERLAVRHEDGIGWLSIGRTGVSDIGVHLVHPMPWYPIGATGTSIFLANLAAHTKNADWTSLAIQAAKTVGSTLRKYHGHPLFGSVFKNGLYGVASAMDALLACQTRLNDDSCGDLALELALQPNAGEWGNVTNPELLNGSASTLLLLMRLYRKSRDERIMERARAIGEGIVSHQILQGPYAGGFRIPNADLPAMGMAHGAAGIAHALAALYEFDPQPALHQAIHAALSFERSHFSPQHGDWPSLQSKKADPSFMSGWCGGAPGIGLARIAMASRFDDDFTPEINAACDATVRHIGTVGHHLCCGEAGRIIFLVAASRFLQRPDLYDAAKHAAAGMLDQFEQQGYWKLQLISASSIVPGLTDGVSGIGLALLSLLDPDHTTQFLTLS